MTRTFFAAGPVRGKGRARSGKGGQHYTPDQTRLYESHIRDCYLRVNPGSRPFTGAVELWITANMTRPASHYLSKGGKRSDLLLPSARAYPTVKPDLANNEKAVMDALNGIAYGDDSAVVRKHSAKCYGDEEGLSVTIRAMEEQEP